MVNGNTAIDWLEQKLCDIEWTDINSVVLFKSKDCKKKKKIQNTQKQNLNAVSVSFFLLQFLKRNWNQCNKDLQKPKFKNHQMDLYVTLNILTENTRNQFYLNYIQTMMKKTE